MTFNEWMTTDEAKDSALEYLKKRRSMHLDTHNYVSYMRDMFEQLRIELKECSCLGQGCPKCKGLGFITQKREGY